MWAIRATGAAVAETSVYPALSNLFNELGKTLRPKVRSIINIANTGAGPPDGGLFTADQFQKANDGKPKAGQMPARGVIARRLAAVVLMQPALNENYRQAAESTYPRQGGAR